MEQLKPNEDASLTQANFYASYRTITDVEVYDYNIRYYDEEFIIELFSKIKSQKLAKGTNYRLHANYILFTIDPSKLEKKSFKTYREYLDYCIENPVTNIPESEPIEIRPGERKRNVLLQRFRTALSLNHCRKNTVYEICASLGKRTYEVYICKKDCVAWYIARDNHLKYQNMATQAFKNKREFLTIIFSPIENFDKMYCKLINSLDIQLLFKNNILFKVNDDVQYVYIIKKGEIELSYKRDDEKNKFTPVIRCTRGSLVGEFEVLSRRNQRKLKAIVLSSECIVYCIQIEYFKLFLNLSKQFRKKISVQANEKYKRVEDLSSCQYDIAKSYTHKKLPLLPLRESFINRMRPSVMSGESREIIASAIAFKNSNCSHYQPADNNSTCKRKNKSALEEFLRKNNRSTIYKNTALNLKANEKEDKLKSYKKFSLSNYLRTTTEYVKSHSINNRQKLHSAMVNSDELTLDNRKLEKPKNENLKANVAAKHKKSHSQMYFADFLQSRLTDYNSYYNAVTNCDTVTCQEKAYIKSFKRKLNKSLGTFINAQN